MNSRIVLFAIVTALLFSSCSSSKKNNNKTAKKLGLEIVDFNYFSSKMKIHFDDGNQSIGLTSSLRMKKDSIVWISIMGPFGVKVGKAKVTKDSVFVLRDFQSKEYYAYSISAFNHKYQTDLSLTLVQNTLLGNLLYEGKSKKIKQGGKTIIKQSKGAFLINNTLSNNKIEQITIKHTQQNGLIDMKYNNFKSIANQIIPQTINIILEQGEMNVLVEINYKNSKFTDEALSFPFNASSKYTRQ